MEILSSKLALSMPQLLMEQVARVLKEEVLKVWQVDDKIRELQVTCMHIEAILNRLGCWQINNTNLEPWLQDLERYSYDIEDLIDDLILSLPIREEDEKQNQHPMRFQILKSARLAVPRQIAALQKKLQGIGNQIESLLAAGAINATQPHNSSTLSPLPYYESPLSDMTPLTQGTSRDRDRQTIILELTSSNNNSCCGVSIIGMDGLGKTALARSIMDDETIKDHFQLVLSACVSGHFQIRNVVQELVADHSRRTTTTYNEPDLISHLRGYMNPSPEQKDLRRTLIILDDIWSVTDEAWAYFRHNLFEKDQLTITKFLTTTRNPKVSEITNTDAFYLNRMTDEDCKKVIIHRAKLGDEYDIWSNDIELIAKKCKGMPIVANKLGLKLSRNQNVRKDVIAELVRCELIWELQEFREVFPSLNLDEPNLPPDLKRCFAYCSLFSPNHKFDRDDLIQLWGVEGFIQPHQGQIFNDLLSRSILQPFKHRDSIQPIYNMHEFNHEFAQLLASKTFCRVDKGTTNLLSSYEKVRHLSLTCDTIDEPLLKKIEQCKGLRTILMLHQNKPKTRTISHNFFHKLHNLRLLDLSHTNISKLPKPISPSKHLRYLDLSYTKVKRLPEPISFLCALRILKLKGCSQLLQLPKDLNQLTELTHLHVDMKKLSCLPSGIGKLGSLEVVDSFFVGKEEGCKVLQLRNMDSLKEIQISGLQNIKDINEAEGVMLGNKSLLKKLVFEWDNRTDVSATNAEEVLKGLKPHNYLEDLVLRNYRGQNFPTWLTSPSCQLARIYLDNFPNCQVVPSLGQLPFLKNLVLRSIPRVENLDVQFCGQGKTAFPCLELLEIHDMKGLVNCAALKARGMPHLRALKIIDCPMLLNLPALKHMSCLMDLEINNCPVLRSLPELPSSLNGEFGQLIITDSSLLTETCEDGKADWPKIKHIPYVEINATKIATTKSSCHPPDNDKDTVSMDEHQPHQSNKPVNGNNVVLQEELCEKKQESPEHPDPDSAGENRPFQGHQWSPNSPQGSSSRCFGCFFKSCLCKEK